MEKPVDMNEALRRYKKQRKGAKERMAAAGVNADEWERRTAKPESEITKPFTPQALALKEEEKRRRALNRMAGGK